VAVIEATAADIVATAATVAVGNTARIVTLMARVGIGTPAQRVRATPAAIPVVMPTAIEIAIAAAVARVAVLRDAGASHEVRRDAVLKDVALKDVAPKDVAPKDVAPKDVAPKDVAPKDVAPKDVAPKDVRAMASGIGIVRAVLAMEAGSAMRDRRVLRR
jgi:hypothetical protein